MAVNDAHRLAPWADVLYAADAIWWRTHAQTALKFPGLKVTIGDNCEFPAVLALRNGGGNGFDDRPDYLRTGMNSAYQALHLAVHMGAARVLLLGLDMRKTSPSHFFGEHPQRLQRESPYGVFAKQFETLVPILAARGVEVINCTPKSGLTCFPIRPLGEVLESSITRPRRPALQA